MSSVGIIGSGFGALGTAVELIGAGHDDIRLWERADALGGVWRDNTYPGAGCDVPSPLYSFSFDVTTAWSRRYAQQPEILAYLNSVADRFDLRRRIQFNHQVVAAHWDEDAAQWELTFADGEPQRVDILISAVGQLSEPAMPNLLGIERFTGALFHSADWDHSVDLQGKRVASVGVGASAIQYVPRIADQASQVVLFQRSPNYIVGKPDGALPKLWAKTMIRPERLGAWLGSEVFARSLTEGTPMARLVTHRAKRNLQDSITDAELRRKLSPDYPLGCKRILFSNDFYPALAQTHVDVVTEPIAQLTPTGIETSDGIARAFDVIIFGTGFASQEFLAGIEVVGPGGLALRDQWRDGAHAYMGMYVPDFPNLFVSYGPNTNLGGGSIIYMLQAQARNMRQVLDRMRVGRYRTVQVRPEVESAYNEKLQQELAGSVWSGCDSWYRHPSGRITSNWPGGTAPYRRMTRQLDPAAFLWG